MNETLPRNTNGREDSILCRESVVSTRNSSTKQNISTGVSSMYPLTDTPNVPWVLIWYDLTACTNHLGIGLKVYSMTRILDVINRIVLKMNACFHDLKLDSIPVADISARISPAMKWLVQSATSVYHASNVSSTIYLAMVLCFRYTRIMVNK
jgi:hypothetical protein